MKTIINVNRANDSLVIMHPATMGHAQCIAEYFGVPLIMDPVVDENGKIDYSISFRSDDPSEVDTITDFMKAMTTEEIHPLVGELQQVQAYLVNRVNFSVISDASEFDMEDFDKGSFALDSIIRNASALKRTLELIRESFETVITNEKINLQK